MQQGSEGSSGRDVKHKFKETVKRMGKARIKQKKKAEKVLENRQRQTVEISHKVGVRDEQDHMIRGKKNLCREDKVVKKGHRLKVTGQKHG